MESAPTYRKRSVRDDALHKSTFTLLYFLDAWLDVRKGIEAQVYDDELAGLPSLGRVRGQTRGRSAPSSAVC